jgi:hypothetical protein
VILGGFFQAFVRVLRRRRRWLAQTRVGAHSRPLFDFGLAAGRLNRAGKGTYSPRELVMGVLPAKAAKERCAAILAAYHRA